MITVNFKSQDITLQGILTKPAAAKSLAIIINGSGKIDRDGNMGKMQLNTSKEIAQSLARHDVASLRFDKRGIGASEGDFLTTTFDDNVADVQAAIDFVKQAEPQMKIILIGHSEGALIATKVGAQRGDLSGIVLLAGFASSGREVLHWQLHQVLNSLQGMAKWIIKLLPINPEKMQRKFLDKVESTDKDVIRIKGIKKFNAGWLRQMLAYEAGVDIAKLSCPVLAITGKKDLQVPVEELTRIAQLANVAVECHAIDDLTHLLRKDFETPSVSHYKKLIKNPLDGEVLDVINEWLGRAVPGN